jgi:hypothetical protein
VSEARPELWRVALLFLQRGGLTSEPWGRDQARVDDLLAELYVLGERPSVDEMRSALAEFGAGGLWAKTITARWAKRVARPTWRPRALAHLGTGWVRPFCIPEQLVNDHGLRSVSERLVDALDASASDYMRHAATDPATQQTQDAAALFGLNAGAVRLWALSQDAVEGMSWPSVLSCALGRRDNLFGQWTNAGRALERERLDRWRAEQDEARLRDEDPA